MFLKKLGNSDHQPCLLGIDIELKKVHPPKFVYIEKPVDNAMEMIKQDVCDAQLERHTSLDTSAEDNYSVIANTITKSIEKNIPTVKTRFRRDRHSLKPWMSDDILKKIKDKDKLYNKVRKSKPDSENHKLNKNLLKSKIQDINHQIMEDGSKTDILRKTNRKIQR